MRRFKGFTLTELMIALAVIGILVAVVTPAIMRTRPNKNKMMVKKTFYTTENIISDIINDENIYPDMSDLCRASVTSSDSDTSYCAWGFDYTAPGTYEGATYEGDWKFAALFKEKLNVKSGSDVATSCTSNATPDNATFCPKFQTSDGVYWDLSGTSDAWESGKSKVGNFDEQSSGPGLGEIIIDVDTSNNTQTLCTNANDDCDTYAIQILANGKLRIKPSHTRAIDYITVNQ